MNPFPALVTRYRAWIVAHQHFPLLKRFRWWVVALGVLVTAYGVFGFFIAPGIVRDQLIANASAITGSQVTVGRVSVNPFMLSVTIRNFLLPDRQGERLFSFDTLYLNFQLSTVVRGAWTFGDLRLVAPYARALVREDGSVNIQDVLPADTAPATAGADEPPTPLLAFRVAVVGGEVTYEDRQRTTPFSARLQPINLSLQDFTTRPLKEGGYQFEAATDRGERLFWRGDFGVVPVRSTGHIALNGFEARTFWSYMQDQVEYEVTGGKAYFEADYQLDLAADPQVFTIRDGKARLDSVTLLDRRDSSVAATIPVVNVSGMQAQALERTIRIAEIRTTGGTISGTVGTDTVLSLTTLFAPRIDPKAPVGTGPDWKAHLERIVAEDYTVRIRDLTTKPPAELTLVPLVMTITDYRDGLPGDAKIDLGFAVDSQGQVKINGTLTPEPSAMDLAVDVAGVPLQPFQPYLNSIGRIVIRSGMLSLGGRYAYRTRGTKEIETFRGSTWIEDMRLRDPKLREDFTRWNRLDVKNIVYSSEPASLEIGQILARGMYLRSIVGPDNVTNIQHIFAEDSAVPWGGVGSLDSLRDDTVSVSYVRRDGAAPPPPAAATDGTPAPDSASAGNMKMRIGEIRVIDGTLNFSDFSLTPNFTVGIEQLNGTIKGINSEEPSSGNVDLQGKVDRYAPARIFGQVNPLSAEAYTDITLDFQGIDLTTFTPYSGKFAGYKIDKGKLSLELHYRLNQRQVIGENRIVFDQLTLGEKVESPDATSLPVKLAVALLKDSEGVIDLDIPVKGSIDDPKFRVMPVILKALVRLFVKAISSPFKLIGAMFGGDGDQMSYVAFAPGSDTLASLEAEKLDTLARALHERPGLKLDVRGTVATSVDREALASRAVLRRLRRGDTTNLGPPTAGEVDRARQLYRAQFNEDPDKLVPVNDSAGNPMSRAQRDEAIARAAVHRLTEHYQVTAEQLQTLALRRAARVKDRLVTADSVPEERVFLLGADTTASAQEGAVRVQLALDAP